MGLSMGLFMGLFTSLITGTFMRSCPHTAGREPFHGVVSNSDPCPAGPVRGIPVHGSPSMNDQLRR